MDNVYPNSSWNWNPKPAYKDTKKLQETAEQLPILKGHIDYLAERIDHYRSIDSINADITLDPEAHKVQVLANQILVVELQAIKSDTESLVEGATMTE